MSNRLDPDQARQIVGPDLGPVCLQRLSADDTRRQITIFYCHSQLKLSALWSVVVFGEPL